MGAETVSLALQRQRRENYGWSVVQNMWRSIGSGQTKRGPIGFKEDQGAETKQISDEWEEALE